MVTAVKPRAVGDRGIAPPTEIADPGANVALDLEAMWAHAAFRRAQDARTAAGV